MSIGFATETLASFLPDALPLLRMHWQEVGACPQTHALRVDVPLYRAIEQVGALHITTARHVMTEDRAGSTSGSTSGPTFGLIGYAVYFVQDYPHVQGLRMAQGDAVYLVPAFRKGFTGVRLLQAAERALQARGVKNIVQMCTIKKDFGCILRRLGYTSTETVYRKEI